MNDDIEVARYFLFWRMPPAAWRGDYWHRRVGAWHFALFPGWRRWGVRLLGGGPTGQWILRLCLGTHVVMYHHGAVYQSNVAGVE